MARIKLGEIFSIDTPKGKAYLHYVYKCRDGLDLIRVLPGLYIDGADDLEQLAKQKELFVVEFPLRIAYHRKLVNLAGYASYESFKMPQYMREEHVIRGEFLGWHIVNTETLSRKLVKKLTPKQAALSPWGIWNDTYLIDRLTEGWTLDKWTSSFWE